MWKAIGEKLRLRASHTRFSIVFSVLLYGACNALNIDKLARWFHQKDGLDYVALGAYLLAGLCLFIAFFTLFAHPRTIKPMAAVIAIVSAAGTYFISKYNVAIDSSIPRCARNTSSTPRIGIISARATPCWATPFTTVRRTTPPVAPCKRSIAPLDSHYTDYSLLFLFAKL
jgi:glucan phosphoethanolaminetransferase (alkaline phosphatase superfamily)